MTGVTHVVGAGLAGLSCAVKLAQGGQRVALGGPPDGLPHRALHVEAACHDHPVHQVDESIGLLGAAARLYAGKEDIKHPEISPVYGDFTGFPPTLMSTGTRDLFLSNAVRVYRKLRNAGIEARLDIYEGVGHAQYGMDPTAPEASEAARARTSRRKSAA